MKVLITCGPTWVPIDDVRVISNVSSGEMGHLIALAFKKHKAQVTVIEGQVTHALSDKKIRIFKYRFFDELAALLKRELVKKYDVVVHAAAVSDYKVQGASKKKLASDKSRTLRLTPAPKLIKSIKRLSPKSFLVGFKLESAVNEKTAVQMTEYLVKEAECDLVVANTLKGGYKGFVINKTGRILIKSNSKNILARRVARIGVHERTATAQVISSSRGAREHQTEPGPARKI